MKHEQIETRESGKELVIPQLGGGKTNGKNSKSVPTSPSTKEISTAPKTAPVEGQVDDTIKTLFSDLDKAGLVPVADKTPEEPKKPVVPVENKPDTTLVRILAWKRPHDSAGERNFVSWLHMEIKSRGGAVEVSKGGNVICEVPYPAGQVKGKAVKRTVLFSCHTDTVHDNCNGDQMIFYDPVMGHIFLDPKHESSGSCLGADDGAGIWLCLEMIAAKVPGTYVFHRGEERGGIGSKALLFNDPSFLRQFEIAIAFDRKGTGDVVITQGGQECASTKFGNALALALNDGTGFDYRISHGGTFTDTRVYRSVIPECANISVGYENAHGQDEQLNYEFLGKLRDRLIAINWDVLPVERDEKKADVGYTGSGYGKGGGWSGKGYGHYKDGGADGKVTDLYPTGAGKKAGHGTGEVDPGLYDDADDHFNKDKADKRSAAVLEAALVSMARTAGEPAILDELKSMTRDDLRDMCDDSDAAFSVVVALFAELEAAYAKVELYRGLADMD